MTRALELGIPQYKAVITDRLIKETMKFYTSINRNKLQTGIKKFKKSAMAWDVLKENFQAFSTLSQS